MEGESNLAILKEIFFRKLFPEDKNKELANPHSHRLCSNQAISPREESLYQFPVEIQVP